MPKRLPIEIPQTAGELTADWLTEVIGIPGARVSDFSTSTPESGVGFAGTSLRVDLTWESDVSDQPATVLIKFPTELSTNRGLVESEGGYDREFDFYELFGDDFPVPIPNLYFSVRDPGRPWSSMARQIRILERVPDWLARFIARHSRKMVRPTKRRFALVIEYIDDARVTPLDQVPPEADLRAVLAAQAQFHAHWWCSPVLCEDIPFGWRTASQVPHILNGTYAVYRDAVVAGYPDLLTPEVMRFADWIDEHLSAAVDHLDEPFALLHGDARSDNMLFTGVHPGEGLTLIDFGMVSSGRPAWDVAYLLSSTLAPGPTARDTVERLCGAYHADLVTAGVTDHSLEQFRNDVDLVLVLMLHRMMIADAVFEGEGYDGEHLASIWLKKITSQLPEELPVIGQVGEVP
jgi:hypothetical protein